MTVTSKKKGESIKLYINDTLHLFIGDRITSIQTYNDENIFYKIEIQTKNNTTLLEYDCPFKWGQIIQELDKLVNHG